MTNMLDDVTLLIPSHNRHNYLERILHYYKDVSLKIIIADSSAAIFLGHHLNNKSITYLHFPHMSMPKKIAAALVKVNTTFTVLCADDDFIIPSGISKCIEFLQRNELYVAAQGNGIVYNKELSRKNSIQFSAMEKKDLSFSIADNDIYNRLDDLFNPYRSFFYAVHYTTNLQLAYNDTIAVENLFLNEYLSAVVPICKGIFIQMPIFYQVREYAKDSDDKTTTNIDDILNNEKYIVEYNKYLNYIADSVVPATNIDRNLILQKLNFVFTRYSKYLKQIKSTQRVSLKKKIGKLINYIPFFGKILINKNREIERKNYLSQIIKNEQDNRDLKKIEMVIKKYVQSVQ